MKYLEECSKENITIKLNNVIFSKENQIIFFTIFYNKLEITQETITMPLTIKNIDEQLELIAKKAYDAVFEDIKK